MESYLILSTLSNSNSNIYLHKNWLEKSGIKDIASKITSIVFVNDDSTLTAGHGYADYLIGSTDVACTESAVIGSVVAYVKNTEIKIFCTKTTLFFPQNSEKLFSYGIYCYFSKLTTFDFGTITIDTSQVTNFGYIFLGDDPFNLKSFDFSITICVETHGN